MQKISIIGLGYVGLPLLCLCSKKGLNVTGVDIDKNKIMKLKKGISPIDDEILNSDVKKLKNRVVYTDQFSEGIKNSSIIIVCVPTPVDQNHRPNLKPLKEACKSISEKMQENSLIIIESTIFPGTTEDIVKPILDKVERKYYLAHCPERIDPGNKKYNVSNIPRVVGGIDKESAKEAAEFYRKIIDAQVLELSSVKAAEATKIMENTFRDVNIAFINEMAKSFDKAGIDILEVIKGASTKPFSFMPHFPGVGVGGHCIPVDPYYLIEKASSIGFNHEFLKLARRINSKMPEYTVTLLEEELKKIEKDIKGAKVGILGLSYKAGVDDIRESPAIEVIKILKEKGADVIVYEPYLKDKSDVKNVDEILLRSNYIILVTDHNEFREIEIDKFKENNIQIIIDGRNCLDKEKIKRERISYHGIGRS